MNEIQFLRDPSFEKGISVHGPSHEDGIVAHFPAESKPIWMLAQWGNYRYPLTQEINYTELIHGFVLETHSAQVTVRPDNNSYDLRLEMRSSAEYTGRMRKDGEDWCHLLVEQGGIMEHTVPLGKLKELRYQAELRLDYCDSHIPVGVFDARRHSCQVHQYFSVEDVVNDEFMWFGVTFFDNRYATAFNHSVSILLSVYPAAQCKLCRRVRMSGTQPNRLLRVGVLLHPLWVGCVCGYAILGIAGFKPHKIRPFLLYLGDRTGGNALSIV